jgi:hypothetical protein
MIEEENFELGELTLKIFNLFNAVRLLAETELMKFTVEELNTLKVFYGKDFTYPIWSDVEELLDGAPKDEYIH